MGETTWAYYERLHRESCLREEQLKQQLEEAVKLLEKTNIYCGGYTPATEFIAKYRGEK